MKLSILIPTINGRELLFDRLMSAFQSQIQRRDDVEIIYLKDNKEMPIGEKRRKLYEMAKGEYSVQWDDDDMPPPYYVEEALKALEQNPDCIGSLEDVVIDGKRSIACHSNRFADWADNVGGYAIARTIFNKDIIRTSICLSVDMGNERYGEDYAFAKRLKASGLLKKEVFIDKIMYYYTFKTLSVAEQNERYGISNKGVLSIKHNSGFFSCASIALMDILIYFNNNQKLPDIVDRSQQFLYFKKEPSENLIPFYYLERHTRIGYTGPVMMMNGEGDFQYMDYRDMNFAGLRPFLYKYFQPGRFVEDSLGHYEWKYQMDYENTCAVFYRGTDKARETTIAPYELFLEKAQEILNVNPNVRFLVLPDENEFWDAFVARFPNSFRIEETPNINKQDDSTFYQIPLDEKPNYGGRYFAAVLMASKCKHLITHSGNGGWWCVAYRGHAWNVHQVLNNKWFK